MAVRDERGHLARDPLSVAYDGVVRQLLIQAIRRHRNHQRGPIAWIASPRAQFRSLDRGGLTRHEREFTRAVYYHVFRVPRSQGAPVHYSAVLEWDKTRREASSMGRLARPVRVTLYKYGRRGPGGGPPVRLSPGSGWVGFQSTEGHRIDS